MNNLIEFKACVEDVSVVKEKNREEVYPVTYVTLKIVGHEPRAGSFVTKEEVSVTFNG